MRKLLVILLALGITGNAYAGPGNSDDLINLRMSSELANYLVTNGIVLTNGTYQKMVNATGTPVSVLRINASNQTELNAAAAGVLSVASTPVAGWDTFGLNLPTQKGLRLVPYVPTMAATPVAGANDIKPGLNVVPTAAANTAAGLPAVPTAGDMYEVFNSGPNAIRVKAYGTPGINGAAAGTYISVATFQRATCIAGSATSYFCDLKTVPTPAGP